MGEKGGEELRERKKEGKGDRWAGKLGRRGEQMGASKAK